jgi:hypothetical protein
MKRRMGTQHVQEHAMKLCPVAIAVGCAKCPVVNVCPAKGIIGDFKAPVEGSAKAKDPAPRK